MTPTILLVKHVSPHHNVPRAGQSAWPLTVTAKGSGMPGEIFVYQKGGQVLDPHPEDAFSCIASPLQLDELSTDRSSSGPFYRRDRLELLCRNAQEVDRIWADIQNQVAQLVRDYSEPVVIGVETAEITATSEVTTPLCGGEPVTRTNMRTRISLSYGPAGTAAIVNGQQVVAGPDTSAKGWLPASVAPSTLQVPAGAASYYNLDADPALKALFPLPQPYADNLLFRNGVLLPYGSVYQITDKTIWWMTFDPNTLAGYTAERISAFNTVAPDGYQEASAPWPFDYVDAFHPGNYPIDLVLICNQNQWASSYSV